MQLSQVEKSVIVTALQQDIVSDRKAAEDNPALAGYVERNVKFREELIAKLEAN
jgi:hypothetical protein